MTFPSSGGRGRRLPASGSFDILWFLQRSVALLPHAIFRPLPGGSPMGAARSMLHASPPGGSLPIREYGLVTHSRVYPLPIYFAGLPPRPCGQIRVARRCRTPPRASSRRSDWSHCYAHLAYVSSASTCRGSRSSGQSLGGSPFSSHHRPRWCASVSFREMPFHESLALPLHQSF
jgi:hypothetical protein